MMVSKPQRSVALGLAFSVWVSEPAAVAAAKPSSCLTPKINVIVPAGPEWQGATAELTEHLRALADLDRCARLWVRPRGSGVLITIATSDGREATRQIESEIELIRTAEALLVLPPAREVRPSALESPPVEVRLSPASSNSTQVELGAGGSLRFGGGPVYVGGGLAAFTQFAVDHWLLEVSARWDADVIVGQPTPSDFHLSAGALGVGVGRRLALFGAHVDGSIGPTIAVESEDADYNQNGIQGTAADFRLALSLRLSGPSSSSVRAFASTEFEASPARIRAPHFIDRALPRLPWWSGGLSVGLLWGAR